MSEHIARSALMRMHLRDVALAPVYGGLVADMQSLSATKPEDGHAAYMARRGELCAAYGLNTTAQNKPFAFSQGIAIIPVHGTLINRFGGSYGYVTGYNFLIAQARAAVADPEVMGIVYDINSYGGEAAGCFECARELRSLTEAKPSIAVVDSNAYSAAYATASAAGKIYVTPSGGAGSIGVVTMHVDMSKMLDKWGIVVTMLYSGEHKVDGNPFEPLPDSVKAEVQASLDKSRKNFAQLVADHRGLDLKAVMDTEARTYRADDALAIGLIDAVATPSEAVRAFLSELSGSEPQPKRKEDSMSTENKPADAANAQAEARKAEKARIAGIQSCEEAKGREALASHLALNTDLSVEDAKGILAASPKTEDKPAEPAKPAAAANPFAAAMAATPNPNVGADGGGQGGENLSPAQQILRDAAMATGRKYG